MNREQSIDDILKLLKDSVSSEKTAESSEGISSSTDESISAEALQEKLKNQYISGDSEAQSESETPNEYFIDSEFLSEAVRAEEDVEATAPTEPKSEPEEEMILDESEPDDELILDESEPEAEAAEGNNGEIVIEQLSLFGEPERTVIKLDGVPEDDEKDVLVLKKVEFTDSSELENIDENGIQQFDIFDDVSDELDGGIIVEEQSIEENTEADVVPVAEEPISEAIEDEAIVDEVIEDEAIVDEVIEDEVIEDEVIEDEVIEDDIKEENIVKEEPHETFLASMRKTGIDFTTDDMYTSSLKVSEAEIECTDTQDEEVIEETLDSSTINLLMQLCDEEELESRIGEERVDEFLKSQDENVSENIPANVSRGKEYMSAEQNELIFENYRRKLGRALLEFVGCAAVAVLAMLLDLVPLIDAKLTGIFDYNDYPAFYALLGLQLIVVAAAIRYKDFWSGIKRAFSNSPTYESLAALPMILVAIYDIMSVIIIAATSADLPNMYNGLAVSVLAVCALCKYLDVLSDKCSFEIYASDAPKFTLYKESAEGAIGRKMYGGGLETDKSIYSMRAVDFPSGYFKSKYKRDEADKVIFMGIIPMLIVGALATVFGLIFGGEVYDVIPCFAVSAYAIIPISYLVARTLTRLITVKKLFSRGIAFSGEYASKQYSDADVMVVGDLHMFKKCRTEDVGIAIYDTKVGYLTLGCLDALYKKIGGPLSGMQMDLPEVFRFERVTIKRMARGGIEAVVDGKHSIIVGEHSFMQRYGLAFPPDEVQNGRSTLCVSLNGKVSAKLSVKYEVEPIFEMLAERLCSDGILCAVQTLDPLISSALIAKSRSVGSCPISVIHGATSDFATERAPRYNKDSDGVICCSSRLKLCEAAVWLKRLARSHRVAGAIATVLCVLSTFAVAFLTFMGAVRYVNYMYLLLYLATTAALSAALCLTCLPTKNYFTVDSLYYDMEKQYVRKQAEQRRARSEKIRKMTKQDRK